MKWLIELIKRLFTKKTPNPVDPVVADEMDISGALIKDGPWDIVSWPINVGLKDVTIGGIIRWTYDRALPKEWSKKYDGAIGNNWLFMQINGRLYGSPSDWLKPGEPYKDFGDVKIALDGVVYRPTKGQVFGFMLSTPARNGVMKSGYRTQVKQLTTP
jgi:hypothetical protein